MSFATIIWLLALPGATTVGPGQPLLDHIRVALQQDDAFSADEQILTLLEFHRRLSDHQNDSMSNPQYRLAADVLLTLVVEGSFDQVPLEKNVAVASTAYLAVCDGAQPEVALGIGRYGFQEQIDTDNVISWTQGYQEAIERGVPSAVMADLVFQTAKHRWDLKTFDLFKQGFEKAARLGFPVKDFATFVCGHFLEEGAKPGDVLSQALRAFKKARNKGIRVALPAYRSSHLLADGGPEAAEPLLDRKDSLYGDPRDISEQLLYGLEKGIQAYLGTPYAWGGRTTDGIDCSGFVQRIFQALGISLPRSSHDQWKVGTQISTEPLQKGDLVFFKTYAKRVSHVGIVTDPERQEFVHASTLKGVVYDTLESRYYRKRYVGARRILLRLDDLRM